LNSIDDSLGINNNTSNSIGGVNILSPSSVDIELIPIPNIYLSWGSVTMTTNTSTYKSGWARLNHTNQTDQILSLVLINSWTASYSGGDFSYRKNDGNWILLNSFGGSNGSTTKTISNILESDIIDLRLTYSGSGPGVGGLTTTISTASIITSGVGIAVRNTPYSFGFGL
jgi:hypothetical protein